MGEQASMEQEEVIDEDTVIGAVRLMTAICSQFLILLLRCKYISHPGFPPLPAALCCSRCIYGSCCV